MKCSVLIVEDSLTSAAVLAERLHVISEVDCEAEHVTTLAEAIKALDARKFDLILLDIGLPDSGPAYTFENILPHARLAPIIVVTIHDDKNMKRKHEDAGAFAYLNKRGLDQEEFRTVVLTALRGASMQFEKEEKLTFEAQTPGGWRGRVTGGDSKMVLLVLLIIICFAAVIFQADRNAQMAKERETENARMFLSQHAATHANHVRIIALLGEGQVKASRQMDVMTYVISLDNDARKSLRLQEPDELRQQRRMR